jgi:hypothetical protein
VGIRVKVTQSEHEMLRIEKDCGLRATQYESVLMRFISLLKIKKLVEGSNP